MDGQSSAPQFFFTANGVQHELFFKIGLFGLIKMSQFLEKGIAWCYVRVFSHTHSSFSRYLSQKFHKQKRVRSVLAQFAI